MRYLLLLIFFSLTLDARTFFLSTPRSGTHLFLTTYTHFFNRGFISGPQSKTRQKIKDWNSLEVDQDLLIASHLPSEFAPYKISQQDQLIYILRDYKENIIGEGKYPTNNKEFIEKFTTDHLQKRIYFINLDFHHHFKGKKLLIHYEDLVLKPKNVIAKLSSFLNCPASTTQENFSSYQKKLSLSRSSYRTEYRSRAKTTSNSTTSHQLKFSPTACMYADTYVQTHYPDLFSCYLMRYQTPPSIKARQPRK
ncbi:MAG: sulfotransferase domain-containing protein [Simkaniaceae bacterium]|nr:sulfotransferase domain-containing protein [Simkaniaceae bacterium]